MMKRKILTLSLSILTLLAAGCAPRYVEVRGERFEAVSSSEEKELVELARLSMKTIKGRLPAQDMKTIETAAPEVRFIYSGDRYGRVIVKWSFPRYEAGIEYEGQLMTRHMTSTVFSKEKQPEVIDFRRRTPRRRALPGPRGKVR